MRRLILTDVHAVLPALEAVIKDAGSVDEVVFLGDLVAFGPHPADCVDLMASLDPIGVRGNHDQAVLDANTIEISANSAASLIWDRWTYDQLSNAHRDFLANLPESQVIQSEGSPVRLTHFLPAADGGYLHPDMPDEIFAARLAKFSEPTVYTGHNHRVIDRSVGGKRLVCFKAVGQAGDRDPVAGYAIEMDGLLEHRIVPLDIERVIQDIQALNLPEPFTTRWTNFVRSGYDPVWSRLYAPKT